MAEVGSQERDPVQSASSLTVALVTWHLWRLSFLERLDVVLEVVFTSCLLATYFFLISFLDVGFIS